MRDDSLRKILYVEDDADIRKIVSMSLEMVGHYAVTACASCAEALQVVDEVEPDLLLLDVMMPDMDRQTIRPHGAAGQDRANLATIPEQRL